MNCLEAQSKIVAFIENKLNDDETVEFVKHIRSCDNCQEELEIYYTLLVGMKELDEDKELSSNFKEEMEAKLNLDYRHVKNRRRIKSTFVFLILAGIVTVGFLGYQSYRTTQYLQEQEKIKLAQSQYYYADYYAESLFHTEEYDKFRFIDYMRQAQMEEEPDYYSGLRTYLNRHPSARVKESIEDILGEESSE